MDSEAVSPLLVEPMIQPVPGSQLVEEVGGSKGGTEEFGGLIVVRRGGEEKSLVMDEIQTGMSF